MWCWETYFVSLFKCNILCFRESNTQMEDDEEYEMLEVQEDEEGAGREGQSGDSSSEESPNKSNSYTASPEKQEDKPVAKVAGKQQTTPSNTGENKTTSTAKLLNSMAGTTTPAPKPTPTAQQTPSATAAALQKKGITMKKTTVSSPGTQNVRSIMKTNQGKLDDKEKISKNHCYISLRTYSG